MKRILALTALLISSICTAEIYHINDKAFFVPERLGKIEFYHHDNEFIAQRDNKPQRIESHQMDKVLRNMPSDKLEKFLQVGYISVNENDAGEISLHAKVRGLGGGLGGFTIGVAVGKFLTYAVCYGGIYVVGLLSGPGAPVVDTAATLLAAPWIELLSLKVGIGCGILGSIATGPA